MTDGGSGERRKPKAVEKLIADARERQMNSALLDWLKGVMKRDQARRDNNGGGGTRKHRR